MASTDPTKTGGIRRSIDRELIARYRRIRTAIRMAVIDQDVFGLTRRVIGLEQLPPIPGALEFAGLLAGEQLERFREWLDDTTETVVLENTGLWLERFVQKAYLQGNKSAVANLRRFLSVDLDPLKLSTLLQNQFHQRRVEVLFLRDLSELRNINAAMATAMTRELAEGLLANVGPKRIATLMNRHVEGIGLKRARVIARTEVIRANAEGQLATFEQFGLEEVHVEAELHTAGDDRVCPQCEGLEGKIVSIEEAHGMIPVHANCRCGWLPFIEGRHTRKAA